VTPLGLAASALIAAAAPDAPRPGAWTDLFNGKDLTGWVVDGPADYPDKADNDKVKPLYEVRDGLLYVAGAKYGFLRYDREFADFDLHAEVRLTKGANSGLGIRGPKYDPKRSTLVGPRTRPSKCRSPTTATRSRRPPPAARLYRYVAPAEAAMRPAGEWNEIDISCVGHADQGDDQRQAGHGRGPA